MNLQISMTKKHVLKIYPQCHEIKHFDTYTLYTTPGGGGYNIINLQIECVVCINGNNCIHVTCIIDVKDLY